MLRSKRTLWTIAGLLVFCLLVPTGGDTVLLIAHWCLRLNGNGYASVADDPALNMGVGDFVIGAWIKPASFPVGRSYILEKYSATTRYSVIQFTNDIEFRINDGTASVESRINVNFEESIWKYILWAIDRSGNATLYVDGALAGSDDISTVYRTLDNTGVFAIGASSSGSSFWHGKIALAELIYFGHSGLPSTSGATPADYAEWRHNNPYADLSKFAGGAWSGYADADRAELLNETDFSASTKWTYYNTGGGIWAIAGGVASVSGDGFNHDLLQSAANRIAVGENSKYYEFTYEVTANTLSGGTVNQRLKLQIDFIATSIFLTESVGTHRVVFLSRSTATTANLRIRLTLDATGGAISIDNVSLTRTGNCAKYDMDGDLTDGTSNGLDLTASGTGNQFVGSTVRSSRFEGGSGKVRFED